MTPTIIFGKGVLIGRQSNLQLVNEAAFYADQLVMGAAAVSVTVPRLTVVAVVMMGASVIIIHGRSGAINMCVHSGSVVVAISTRKPTI